MGGQTPNVKRLHRMRAVTMAAMRQHGATWKAIGEAYGVSSARVRQIVYKVERRRISDALPQSSVTDSRDPATRP